ERLGVCGVLDAWRDGAAPPSSSRMPEFPPMTEICSPGPLPPWEAGMLRASAALRMIHAVLTTATAAFVNKIALHLQAGGDLPGVAPTNNPGGWHAYGEIFREASVLSG